MPIQSTDHAWHDYRTPHTLLAALPDLEHPVPGNRMFEGIGRALGDAIERGHWAQGEKLPPAAAIAHRFGCSVDTARAALRWLIDDGYGQRQPGGATYATGPKARP